MAEYRNHIFKQGENYVIKSKHVHPGLWISPVVKVSKVEVKDGVWHISLEHVEGTPLGTLSSKDGEAVLTIDAEG